MNWLVPSLLDLFFSSSLIPSNGQSYHVVVHILLYARRPDINGIYTASDQECPEIKWAEDRVAGGFAGVHLYTLESIEAHLPQCLKTHDWWGYAWNACDKAAITMDHWLLTWFIRPSPARLLHDAVMIRDPSLDSSDLCGVAMALGTMMRRGRNVYISVLHIYMYV
ncbi:hypothetical protein GGR53DRAFT_491629 [Hypoxylon sp. FL1150]|nr:hypothetical protein GGR53DRAFT_491629 [Hypoxylon sp. FL1150]